MTLLKIIRNSSTWSGKALKGRVAVAALLAGSLLACQGQLIINVGNTDLLPNTSGQVVNLFVQNTGVSAIDVAGLSINIQVADSGPPPGLGSISGPHITGVDILTGTVFQSNNSGQADAGSVPQFANWTTSTSSGTVSLGAGTTTKLTTVTLDTTGFSSPATWAFNLGNTINGQTKYFDSVGNDILPTIIDGTISVVPEPAMVTGVSAVLCLGFAACRVFKSYRSRSRDLRVPIGTR